MQPLWKTVWRLLQRLGTELPHAPAIPLLCIYTPPPSHTHNESLPTNKKERYPASWDIMDGPWGQYAKWNKSDRERQIQCDFTHLYNLKKQNEKKNETKVNS